MKDVLICLIGAVAIGGFLYGCNASIEKDEQARQQMKIQWMQFTAEHHCHLVKDSSFFDPNETWRCDGFDIKH